MCKNQKIKMLLKVGLQKIDSSEAGATATQESSR